MAIVGGVIGLAGAFGLARLGQALLFGVQGPDPTIIGATAAVMLLVALGAAAAPVRRAVRVNPCVALKAE